MRLVMVKEVPDKAEGYWRCLIRWTGIGGA
jgi:hypothetical protein